MNKKTIRIAGWALGLSMAIGGIGAAVSVNLDKPVETQATASAVPASITISFANSANSATEISSSTNASTVIASASRTYFTSKPFTVNSGKAYYGDTTSSIRVGKSKNSGSLSMALNTTNWDFTSRKVTSVIVNARAMNDGNAGKAFTINGVDEANEETPATTNGDFTFNLNTSITSITIATSSCAVIFNSITINSELLTNQEATGMSITPSALTIYQGENGSFTPTLTGWSGSHEETIGWVSSHPSIIAAPADSEDGEEVVFTAGEVAVSTDVTLTGTVKVAGGASQSIVITVKPPRTLTSVSLTGDMTNKAYMAGASWDLTGLTVTFDYNEGEDPVATLAEMVADTEHFTCKFDPATAVVGTTSLRIYDVSYTSFAGAIAEKVVTGITVSPTYNKVTEASELTVGDSFVVGVAGYKKLMGNKHATTDYRLVVDASDAQMNDDKTKVSASLPSGAVVVTLLKGSASGKFYLYDITNDKYLNPSTSGNYIGDVSSLEDAAEMGFAYSDGNLSVSVGADRIFAYNNDYPRISSYKQSYGATYFRPALYKLAGSSVKTAVTTFANNYLKMNDEYYEGDKTTVNCATNYATLKTEYAKLTDAQKNVLQYASEFADARNRMSAWAIANGETFTYGNATPFGAAMVTRLTEGNGNMNTLLVVGSIMGTAAVAVGLGIGLTRKRKED